MALRCRPQESNRTPNAKPPTKPARVNLTSSPNSSWVSTCSPSSISRPASACADGVFSMGVSAIPHTCARLDDPSSGPDGPQLVSPTRRRATDSPNPRQLSRACASGALLALTPTQGTSSPWATRLDLISAGASPLQPYDPK